MAKQFFNEAKDQSVVKTAIVTKYFDAWSQVILPWAERRDGLLGYLDLFAGPGRFEDGTTSTPLLILSKAIANPRLADALVTRFNDASDEHSSNLKSEIDKLPGIESLKFQPVVSCDEVGDQFVKQFSEMRLIPTLFFVDPFGYKGLSLGLINSVLKDWGCDCIFFFNYNRINMGLSNDAVSDHMAGLFGNGRAASLRGELDGLSPEDRELAVVEALAEELNLDGKRFVLPFRFRHSSGTRTSHHLIFVSKNIRGYEIMKSVMAKESSNHDQGVASFEYNRSFRDQGLLFELSRPLDDLQILLCDRFAGQSLTRRQMFDQSHVGTPFVPANYLSALLQLELLGRISVEPPVDKRRKNTMSENKAIITFPKKG
ncbi:hypothetical protein LF1_05900 [Rubripirellula obstinata]|uniref:GMT-like wHTH domain-containing protein n=1 Tax=Rubripirellula obstinata TaxID=406547 RepID=A0A5B1CDY0_9BACT|nr:three-Cys-motif partner protein TcmP [Rubripirellula obstinata]KAA1258075.1 hypothetical protein LF1_05900 [Rubripirellula obstinata]